MLNPTEIKYYKYQFYSQKPFPDSHSMKKAYINIIYSFPQNELMNMTAQKNTEYPLATPIGEIMNVQHF